jgi:L-rhamnose-H+ transport protein
MEVPIDSGIASVLLGGFLSGSFALPMKRMPGWRWENTWLLYSTVGMVALPWTMAIATVPEAMSVYRAVSWQVLIQVAVFGFGWGVGSIMFGWGIRMVGMALGFSIILGITSSLGSVLPLVVLGPHQLLTGRVYALMAGQGVVFLGIVLCAVAGRRREQGTRIQGTNDNYHSFGLGLVICILSGIFSAMLNFSFFFGKQLEQRSLSLGASPAMASNPIWALALTSGFLANALYCVYLLRKNRSWRIFSKPNVPIGYWLGGITMGALWFGGIAFYGMGAVALGPRGPFVGWPMFVATNIIAANICGALTREWAAASGRSITYAWIGNGVLIAAVYVISLGNRVS